MVRPTGDGIFRTEWLHARAASDRTGLSAKQLRECVELGLINDYIATISGKRRYHIADLQGLSELYRSHHDRVQTFEDRLQAETQPLFDQIAELQQIQRQLLIRILAR